MKKRLLIAALIIFGVSLCMDAKVTKRPDYRGNRIKEWEQYNKIQYKDRPQKELEILQQIKEEALREGLPVDFYHAGEQLVQLARKTNWKSVDDARKEWEDELEAYGNPLLVYCHLDGNNREKEKAIDYALAHRDELASSYNETIADYLLRGNKLYGSDFGSDLEKILWINLRNEKAQEPLLELIAGDEKKEPVVRREIALTLKDPMPALEKLAKKYSESPFAPVLRSDILQLRMDTARKEYNEDESFYRSLLDDCRAHLAGIDKKDLKEIGLWEWNAVDRIKRLEEDLTKPQVRLSIRNNTIFVSGRNIRKIRLETDDGRHIRIRNDKERLYVYDTVNVALPAFADGRHSIIVTKPYSSILYNQYTISLAVREQNGRLCIYAADHITGEPLKHVTVHMVPVNNKKEKKAELDLDGYTPLPEGFQKYLSENQADLYCTCPGNDGLRMSDEVYIPNYFQKLKADTEEQTVLYADIYRNQGAYRPGDTLKIKVVAYEGDSRRHLRTVREGTKLKLIIRDAEGKEVCTEKLTANQFGSAAASIPLPKGRRNGLYSAQVLQGKDNSLLQEYFRVDDFILPSFYLDFDHPAEIPKKGQPFQVTGRIVSYSEHAVDGVHLSAILKKGKNAYTAQAVPEADGSFSLPFTVAEKGRYELTVSVTDTSGETLQFDKEVNVDARESITAELVNAGAGMADLPYSGRSCPVLDCNTAEFSINVKAYGERILKDVPYTLLDRERSVTIRGACKKGELVSIDMSGLHDGIWLFVAGTAELSFVKITGKPVSDPIRSWFLPGDSTVENRIEASLHSSESRTWAIATLFSPSGSILECRSVSLDARSGVDSAALSFDYSADYPDAVRLEVFYFREMSSCIYTQVYHRQRHETDLPLAFSRFEDRTRPRGVSRITVHSTPCIEATAAVWDASQDAIAKLEWEPVRLQDPLFHRAFFLPKAGTITGKDIKQSSSNSSKIWGIVLDESGDPIIGAGVVYQNTTKGAVTDMDGRFEVDYLDKPLVVSSIGYVTLYVPKPGSGMVLVLEEDTSLLDETIVIGYGVRQPGVFASAMEGMVSGIMIRGTNAKRAVFSQASSVEAETIPVEDVPDLPMREVFTQALAFEPFLYPDANGDISFEVAASDKLSTYHVAVFAHDRDMRSAVLRRDMLVTIPVKVSVHEPRYLYEGDSLRLTASVSNISGEALDGRLIMALEMEDAAEDRMVPYAQAVPVTVPASGTASTDFAIAVPHAFQPGFVPRSSEPVYKLRLVFEGDGFSDGIRIGIPVRSAEQHITESHSAFIGAGADPAVTADSLRRLFTNLPGGDAVTEVRSFRSLVEAGLAESRSGDSKDAISLSSALYAGDTTRLAQVLACRNEDGGFAWMPEMKSSPIVSAVLLERFARLRDKGMAIPDMEPTVHWLDSIQFSKKRLLPWMGGLSREQYIYLRSLWPRVPFVKNKPDRYFRSFARTYLTPGKYDYAWGDVLYRARRTATLKRLSASDEGLALARSMGEVVLPAARFRKAVENDLQTIREYAQVHPDGGIFFPNAVWPLRGLQSSEAYAHVMIAELLPELSDGLLAWLLLQKETQSWGVDPAFVDALEMLSEAPDSLLDRKVVTATAERTLPFAEVQAAGNGITVRRAFFREADHSEIKPGDVLDIGEKILAEYTVWSAENRSFMRLDAWREASLEPCNQLSGPYTLPVWGGYRNVRADRTEFWFDSWPEETTVLKETFFVTRAGSFQAPAVTIESVYAPHYRANSPASMPIVCQ